MSQLSILLKHTTISIFRLFGAHIKIYHNIVSPDVLFCIVCASIVDFTMIESLKTYVGFGSENRSESESLITFKFLTLLLS